MIVFEKSKLVHLNQQQTTGPIVFSSMYSIVQNINKPGTAQEGAISKAQK